MELMVSVYAGALVWDKPAQIIKGVFSVPQDTYAYVHTHHKKNVVTHLNVV